MLTELQVFPLKLLIMAKTCPSCGYNPIGPFIDNCPVCAEPVRNVCSDNRRSGRPANRQHLLLIGGVLVA
ncbi:MAG TPA: hypothetical protein VG097_10730, partial [Gemmata sp.]|nr:hypothetical protein [Gemmata sp.]